MSPAEERDLYERDRHRWAELKAPWWLDQMLSSEARKRELWNIAGPELRAAIVKLQKEQMT